MLIERLSLKPPGRMAYFTQFFVPINGKYPLGSERFPSTEQKWARLAGFYLDRLSKPTL